MGSLGDPLGCFLVLSCPTVTETKQAHHTGWEGAQMPQKWEFESHNQVSHWDQWRRWESMWAPWNGYWRGKQWAPVVALRLTAAIGAAVCSTPPPFSKSALGRKEELFSHVYREVDSRTQDSLTHRGIRFPRGRRSDVHSASPSKRELPSSKDSCWLSISRIFAPSGSTSAFQMS